jgi:hypothetical protein
VQRPERFCEGTHWHIVFETDDIEEKVMNNLHILPMGMKQLVVWTLLSGVFLCGTGSYASGDSGAEKAADLVVHNARVTTQDVSRPIATAVFNARHY